MTDRPLVERPPVAGGLDLDVPGRDVRLRATRWPGEGVPVLLLHGLASSRRFWDLVVPGLAGLRVVALDQRGHGDSERPTGPYDGATVVGDALTALDALGRRECRHPRFPPALDHRVVVSLIVRRSG